MNIQLSESLLSEAGSAVQELIKSKSNIVNISGRAYVVTADKEALVYSLGSIEVDGEVYYIGIQNID